MVGSSAMSSRRRPKRQRTRTTIYTDDNPTTFTTKKKRNSGGSSSGGGHTDDQNFSPSQGESSVSTPTPRPTPLTASSNTNANTNANFGWQQQEESVSEESESMPPPAPVVKRGPGRPPRNRTATTPGDHSHSHSQSQSQSHHPHHTRASSSSAGINGNVNVNVNVNVNGGANSITPNRNQHHHPDSYASPELPTPITSRSAPMSLSSTSTSTSPGSDLPVVVKRKRGRPPKNRPKQEGGSVSILYSISTSASASTEPSPDRSGSHSLSMDRPEALASAGESEHQHQQHHQQQHHQHQHHTRCNPLGRRSLPETSSSSTELVGTALRNRRSLDSVRSKNAPRCQNSNSNSNPKTKRKPPKKKRTSAGGSRRGRANSSTSWTPPQKDSEGTFVGHSVTVAPILPPVLVHDNDIDDNNDHDINYDRAETADNNTSNSNNNNSINSDNNNNNNNSNNNNNNNNRIRQELQSRYPSIFGGTGIPKSSSSLATPFSSASHGHAHPHPYPYASSGTAKGKSNQSQHGSSRLPAWTPLYDPPVFFDDDYDRETGKLDVANTMSVTRSITALTVRKPDNDYLVLGDSVGFVTIYSLGRDNINLPIAQLESVACQQRGKTEQERLRAEIRRRTKARGSKNGSAHHHHSHHHHHNHQQQQHKESNGRPVMAHPLHAALGSGAHQVRSILLDTSDTAIHALGMIENRVVLANIEQLECMDVPSGTSLWVCALLANRFVTSLDMHLHTFDVLVSCSKTPYDQEASASSSSASASSSSARAGGGAVAPTISPLMLLQHSENNVEICDANSPMLVQSPSCTAIWDSGAHNRLLFIALSSNRQEHQLVLVSGGSIDSWKVACKTKIPTRGGSASSNSNSCSETKLSQSPGGLYTLVASSRGIRLYQTESLQLLHVYGDQLALHGQSVLWKDCWLAGSYFYETNNRNTNTNTNRSTRKSTNRSTNTNNTTHNFTRAARGLPKEWLQCDDLLLAGAGAGAGETTTIGAAAEPAAVVGDTTSDGAVDGNDHGGDDDHENATRDDPKNINHHNINYHNRNYNHRTVPDLPPYIIGVPHTKGPKELCENLHVWKVEQPSVVPTITIPLPPKSDGALGLVGAGNGIANQSSIGSGGSSGSSGGSGNHQTGVAKDRIVLVTNNGKGHLLLPQMESNFAGIMYPPGYRVVTNNVEYIEGEDALDHVVPAVEDEHEAEHEHEHETDEQEKEHEEEHGDVDILGHSDDEHDNVDVDIDDDDDDDLRKAIQQSLLELKKDEIAREAMKHDTYVDILVPENEPEREYLPCRPEPYLRQMINTEIEDDEGTVTTDDDEEENDGTTGTATGTTTATGAKSERRSNSNNGHPSKASGKEQKATAGAASSSSSSSHRRTNEVFVSHVLDLMPNMQKPKPLEEDCMSFTTTKVVVAVNPVLPARPGRGRKSRAANLETMLKASINPYLQSMMVSKQGVPGSGKGSKLWAGPISALDNRHHGCRRAIGSADAGVSTGALSSSANGSHSHSYAYAYTANNTLTVDTNAGPTLQHRSSSPMEVQNDDEADVVMGLLGLSPCHVAAAAAANNSNSNIVPSNGFVVSGSNQFDTRVGVGMGGVVAGAAGATGAGAASSHVYSKGATYLGPSSLALFNAANANANASNEHIQAFTTSSSVFSSDRDSPVEGMTPTSMSAGANANASNNNNNNNVQPNHQPQPNNSVVDRSCSACRGRLVIHSCGRRSLPIDYEEIARAEREKKEKEEEEKKRLRAEKRRLADQRRREAKKQKQRELEEKRQREELEEQERLQVEERRRLQADFASQDLDRQRRDLIVASYANHVSNNGAGLQTEEEGEGLAQTIAVHSSHVVAHPNNYDNENDSHNGLHQLTSTVLHNGSSFGPFSRVQANGSGSIFEQAAQLPSSNRDVKGKGNYQTKIAAHSNQTGTYSGTHSDHCNQSNPPAASSGITTTSSNKQVAYSRPVPSSLVQDASTSEIDALLGLANLADRKTTEPSGVVAAAAATAAAPSGPEWSNYASASASHGFDDETVSGSVSGEARRGGIPSYAALRGHVHAHAHAQYTDETATTGPATATARSMTTNMATATATAANSFVNGYRHHQTGESQSYAWSARPEG